MISSGYMFEGYEVRSHSLRTAARSTKPASAANSHRGQGTPGLVEYKSSEASPGLSGCRREYEPYRIRPILTIQRIPAPPNGSLLKIIESMSAASATASEPATLSVRRRVLSLVPDWEPGAKERAVRQSRHAITASTPATDTGMRPPVRPASSPP